MNAAPKRARTGMSEAPTGAVATVIVPAHDEESVIGRLLRELVRPDDDAAPRRGGRERLL